MTDNVLNVVLGLIATGISAGLGWLAQTVRRRRRLGRMQDFFGMPAGAECLLVVNRKAGGGNTDAVARRDAYALMELAALVRECGARAEIAAHDEIRQGLGSKAEFCIGGPSSNARAAAHVASWLPGVDFTAAGEPRAPLTLVVGEREFPYTSPESPTYVLLARLHASPGTRPVFLIAGQTATSNHAAVRYLAAHHRSLARRHGTGATFALVLKVVNAEAYGPDVVEFEADVTGAATTARPVPVAA
ncbi:MULTISPECIES: hypothetical protein [Kitasatospora]|uniref:Secreted protein n=2 Tax=Kitasatospora TaxID=2063 RepID=A0ABT1IZM2_9ACTN|nr:hypothetical protein [Kitasatospora paracochleata]MCP2309986.1 hypothetical protein [Kitasatospora paracochleata]